MNFSTLIGFIASAAIFTGAIFMSLDNAAIFFEVTSALIVVGGTFAATMICFPISQIFNLLRVFVRRMLGKSAQNYNLTVSEISQLSAANRKGKKAFEAEIGKVTNLFLRDAAEALFYTPL